MTIEAQMNDEQALGNPRPRGRPFRIDRAVIVHLEDCGIVEAREITTLLPCVETPAAGGAR